MCCADGVASTVWSGRLSFGLVSIPVRLIPAARARKIPLRRVAAPAPKPFAVSRAAIEPEIEVAPAAPRVIEGEESRVHYEPVRNAERVPETRVELAYEFEQNRYVPLAKEALAQLAAPTSTDIELSEFVKLE